MQLENDYDKEAYNLEVADSEMKSPTDFRAIPI